jgi:predicted GIY-YIG superfamily endonuclease
MKYQLYILQSQSTNRYYIGQTQDIQKRLTYHNANYSKGIEESRALAARLFGGIYDTG